MSRLGQSQPGLHTGCTYRAVCELHKFVERCVPGREDVVREGEGRAKHLVVRDADKLPLPIKRKNRVFARNQERFGVLLGGVDPRGDEIPLGVVAVGGEEVEGGGVGAAQLLRRSETVAEGVGAGAFEVVHDEEEAGDAVGGDTLGWYDVG